ncbi:MAG: NAD-dependent epimerase/dehydratase family protein [Deltaproteobacteria bacterium]|jgi:UDP-glucose 4-epimerase|nr:NAD-dependent epimerase/dehydratase family protein [Deltaproteobacteria bacterium]
MPLNQTPSPSLSSVCLTPGAAALVTGGAGFIGSRLAKELLNLGLKVKILDNLSCGSFDNLNQIKDSVQFYLGDVRDRELVEKLSHQTAYCFHLAGMSSVPQSQIEPDLCLDINGLGTLNVLRAASLHKVSRVIYASTSAVYGDAPLPHGELTLPRPNTPYAALKLLGEHLALFFYETEGLETISLRFFNVYGPGQSAKGADAPVVPVFNEALKNSRAPIIYGDGLQSRDFLHVSDAVRALIVSAVAPFQGNGVYNVATGKSASLLKVLKILRRRSPLAPEAIHLPARAGDPKFSIALVDKAIRELGFEAKIKLSEGLSQI